MRPLLLRPPVFFVEPVRLFSGFDFVTSSNFETVMKRRPGLVGLNLRKAIGQWASRWHWWMPGSLASSQARTQGAFGLVSPGATEDAAWRSVIAGQAPPNVPGWPTKPE